MLKIPENLLFEAKLRGLRTLVINYYRIKPIFRDAKLRLGYNKKIANELNITIQTASRIVQQLRKVGWLQDAPKGKHWIYELKGYHTIWKYFGLTVKETKTIYTKGVYKDKTRFNNEGKRCNKRHKEIFLIKFQWSPNKQQLLRNIVYSSIGVTNYRWLMRKYTDKRFSKASEKSDGVLYSCDKAAYVVGLKSTMSGSNLRNYLVGENKIVCQYNDVIVEHLPYSQWKRNKKEGKYYAGTYFWQAAHKGSFWGTVYKRTCSTITITSSSFLAGVNKMLTSYNKETLSCLNTIAFNQGNLAA